MDYQSLRHYLQSPRTEIWDISFREIPVIDPAECPVTKKDIQIIIKQLPTWAKHISLWIAVDLLIKNLKVLTDDQRVAFESTIDFLLDATLEDREVDEHRRIEIRDDIIAELQQEPSSTITEYLDVAFKIVAGVPFNQYSDYYYVSDLIYECSVKWARRFGPANSSAYIIERKSFLCRWFSMLQRSLPFDWLR